MLAVAAAWLLFSSTFPNIHIKFSRFSPVVVVVVVALAVSPKSHLALNCVHTLNICSKLKTPSSIYTYGALIDILCGDTFFVFVCVACN